MGRVWPALDIHVPACDDILSDLVIAELDDFHPTAIHESDDGSSVMRAFFATPASRDAAARALAGSFGHVLLVTAADVEDDDWAARSQAQLGQIRIGHVVVAPPWDATAEFGRDVVVLIRPSMGFGTGHHATTRLALKALQDLPIEGRTVLDVGCGSGVLAIAAVKLGAASAIGVDIDPDALDNAHENADLNEIGDRVRFDQADVRGMSAQADIVTANLTGALLERSAAALCAAVSPGGFLIASGFMETEERLVVRALGQSLAIAAVTREDEWTCAIFTNPAR